MIEKLINRMNKKQLFVLLFAVLVLLSFVLGAATAYYKHINQERTIELYTIRSVDGNTYFASTTGTMIVTIGSEKNAITISAVSFKSKKKFEVGDLVLIEFLGDKVKRVELWHD